MGRLKQHYFDEIADLDDTSDPDPRGPFPMPPVHVVMEKNNITGDVNAIHVCNHIADAQVIVLSRNAARYLTANPEQYDYYMVEAVPCLG